MNYCEYSDDELTDERIPGIIDGIIDKNNVVVCGKCGSTRTKTEICAPEGTPWITVTCKRCNTLLFCNGA